jgi:hypothetical protein
MGRLSSFLGWRGVAVSSFQPRKPKTVLAPDSENNPLNHFGIRRFRLPLLMGWLSALRNAHHR